MTEITSIIYRYHFSNIFIITNASQLANSKGGGKPMRCLHLGVRPSYLANCARTLYENEKLDSWGRPRRPSWNRN